ncbi:MAG: hypothetical protein QM756_37960 [Polyangiaceae bacterium]
MTQARGADQLWEHQPSPQRGARCLRWGGATSVQEALAPPLALLVVPPLLLALPP